MAEQYRREREAKEKAEEEHYRWEKVLSPCIKRIYLLTL